VSYALARPVRLSTDTFAGLCGVHPDLVRRMAALGLLEVARDAAGDLWFTPDEVRVMARIRRLRAGLDLNYAALGLVLDLLDRIEELERAVPRQHSRLGVSTWT
jgi:chaperone modulatory protein CbpM